MINYYLITKPGIVLGNLFTLAAGFILGSKGEIHILLFLATLLGLAFIMGSACVFNNYIDRAVDQKMERTKNRALVLGLIPARSALIFATLLGLLGAAILYQFTNSLALLLAAIGFFVYVVLYSLWKCKTVFGTAIGSIAGAIPPVVGYTAASGQFDLAAALLFALLVFWQMPHFFAIALYNLEDYAKAHIPVLPLVKGVFRTKIHMAVYIFLFTPIAMLLTYFGYTGFLFLFVVTCIGFAWFSLSLIGFNSSCDKQFGRQMFLTSLVMIGAICLVIPFERYYF